jgi:catechol 2,3-dioxygenase-like lactoylglutathione lyase family enzyme
MSRVQLAINVTNLESSIAFYSKLLSIEPAKIRPGYANFAVSDPPLKLVLIEQAGDRGHGVEGALNHLGVECESPDEVAVSAARLSGQGMTTDIQESTTCCYALQEKVWVDDPDQVPWEIYSVLADADGTSGLSCSSDDRGADAVEVDVRSTPHCC